MPSSESNLTGPDYFMLIAYFALMLVIGLYFYRYMRGMKDYFSGGNNIPWWLSGVSFYMSSFSVFAFIGYPALCYQYGWVGVTALWVAVPATLFSVLLFAKRWRRARINSPVEYIENRYGMGLRQAFAWQGIPVKMVDDGLKLVAIGKFIEIGLGFDLMYSILGAGGIMLLYTFMGGLWAVTVTDFVQFVILAAAVLIVLPLSLQEAGGMAAFIENSPEGFFKLTSPEYTWVYITFLMLLYCLAWSSINWPLIQRYYCVKDEREALKVGWLVVALYVIGPPLMFLPAMAAPQFIPGLEDAGDVYPVLCSMLLPAGILGLVIAAMFAATMSMLSSDYNVCASVLTNDVYKRLIRKDASDRELVTVGRIMTLVIGSVALGIAMLLMKYPGEDLFKTMVALFGVATAPVGIPMLLGLLSQRFTNLAAVWAFILGIITGLLLYFLFPAEGVRFMGELWQHEIVLFIGTSVVSLATMLIVSAVKPMGEREQVKVAEFHRRLNTPIGELDEDIPSPAEAKTVMMSPFRVVGISIFLIGLMMLAVIPWTRESLAFWIDLFLGLALAILGAAMALKSSAPEPENVPE